MSIIKKGNDTYKYEFYWKYNKNVDEYDSNNDPLKFPIHNDTNWDDKNVFIAQLQKTQKVLINDNKYKKLKKNKYKDCLLCDKKNIITKIFTVNNVRWDNGMEHYIRVHNIIPNDEFIDYIYRFTNNLGVNENNLKLQGKEVVKNNKKMLKLDRNQILIMDALMWHGGKKYYKDCDNNNIYRFSEHYGLLDFNNSGLEKIIIFANTTKVDPIDDDIFLPRHNVESFDYEYIFHTHPVTGKKPGGRVYCGVLYEFPSVSDVFHFINHYNTGRTCGSLVITAEGLYIIKKLVTDNKQITINDDDLYNDMLKVLWKSQEIAISEYGTEFNANKFYSVIAQDRTYINMINEIINKHDIQIDYYPRIRDKHGKWFINTIYLSVFATDIKT